MVRAGLADKLDEPKNANDIRRCYKPGISAYYLRHNYITMCWKAGMDPLAVQRIVGHKDYRTTANIYTHLNEEHLSKAYDDISSVFSEEKNKVAHLRSEFQRKIKTARKHTFKDCFSGSPGRARTYNNSVNSRVLCH